MNLGGVLARRKLADDPFTTRVDRFVGEGTWTIDVPATAAQLIIKCWGPGGGGSRVAGTTGFGAGAGAYSTRTIALSSDGGKDVLVAIYAPGQGRTGSPGNGTSAFPNNGAGASCNLTAGSFNLNAHMGASSTTSATGGTSTASGGSTNTDGPAATGQAGASPAETPPVAGIGKGGDGGCVVSGVQQDGQNGGPGCVELHWS